MDTNYSPEEDEPAESSTFTADVDVNGNVNFADFAILAKDSTGP